MSDPIDMKTEHLSLITGTHAVQVLKATLQALSKPQCIRVSPDELNALFRHSRLVYLASGNASGKQQATTSFKKCLKTLDIFLPEDIRGHEICACAAFIHTPVDFSLAEYDELVSTMKGYLKCRVLVTLDYDKDRNDVLLRLLAGFAPSRG